MHDSETTAEEVYKAVIQKYPKSVKVLRAYVRFLREIKNDPWKAQKYDLQADNYDQVLVLANCLPIIIPYADVFSMYQAQKDAAKEALFAANIGVGGDMLSLLSEDNPDGVVMITEDGKITFANKASPLCKAFCSVDCCCYSNMCSVLNAESSEHVWLH